MATWLTQCSEHHLVLLTRRNCRKTSGTSGATGGDSLGKPLCRACHLDRTESGWCWNSCSLDIRAQLLPRTRASCTRIERNSFVGTTPRTGTENNKNANSSAFRSSSSIKHRRRTTTECYRCTRSLHGSSFETNCRLGHHVYCRCVAIKTGTSALRPQSFKLSPFAAVGRVRRWKMVTASDINIDFSTCSYWPQKSPRDFGQPAALGKRG